MIRLSVLFAPVLAALLLVSACAQSPSPTEEAQAAPDFTLEDADGNEVTLSKLKGKVVLLNFWATWCGPCKIEMPWFADFQRKYKDRGFTVLAVSSEIGTIRPTTQPIGGRSQTTELDRRDPQGPFVDYDQKIVTHSPPTAMHYTGCVSNIALT